MMIINVLCSSSVFLVLFGYVLKQRFYWIFGAIEVGFGGSLGGFECQFMYFLDLWTYFECSDMMKSKKTKNEKTCVIFQKTVYCLSQNWHTAVQNVRIIYFHAEIEQSHNFFANFTKINSAITSKNPTFPKNIFFFLLLQRTHLIFCVWFFLSVSRIITVERAREMPGWRSILENWCFLLLYYLN